ncbi:DUF3667 domain-containing protein [Pseudoduganella namucuonensis]|uniref:DUF3667 domain-containing protein n=1 Tax=Pseudoduganella namucuonensis TaxID=1035707 RepID=UPI00353092CD
MALEGRLWGTVSRLLFRPGLLTIEYMRGRRKRYVEPLRLYLSLSILFFALLNFSGAEPVKLGQPDANPVAAQAVRNAEREAADIRGEIISQGRTVNERGEVEELGDRIRQKAPFLTRQWEYFEAQPDHKKSEMLRYGFFKYGPYAMFALMPLFALYLKLLYIGSGRRYGEHLLFALHTSAFAFVMFTGILFSPHGLLTFALVCWLIGYLPWAMRRVYNSGKLTTFLRWSVLMLAHGISLAVAIGLAMGAGATSGH